MGFKSKEDFIDHEHKIGNLTILEKSLNSSVQNKNATEKVDGYGRSILIMTKKLGSEIDTKKEFTKLDVQSRTKVLVGYCVDRWWSDKSIDQPLISLEKNIFDIPEIDFVSQDYV